jgi:GNAT superfamily N-acetyltransferase
MVEVRQLTGSEGRRYVTALAGVLLDCIAGGASVSFMASLTRAEAESFFEQAVDEVEQGCRILLAAFDEPGLIGTVQVVAAPAPNQPHRADVAKLLVHRSARGRGVGRILMEAAEDAARSAGKTLLVLDTVTGDSAERLYQRLGWTRLGVIPNYALYPDGRWCDTTVFYKELSEPRP